MEGITAGGDSAFGQGVVSNFFGVVVSTGTAGIRSDTGISAGVTVALSLGVSAAGGVFCSVSFSESCYL